MAKNTAKYLSYTEAWRRINDAMSKGFYFEVVTLCESIISDRLLSYVCGVNPSSSANIRTPFARLIKDWRRLGAGTLSVQGHPHLGAEVDAWRVERNLVLHGLTKSPPGSPTAPVQPFIVRAEQAAKTGVVLARVVSTWQRAAASEPPSRDGAFGGTAKAKEADMMSPCRSECGGEEGKGSN